MLKIYEICQSNKDCLGFIVLTNGQKTLHFSTLVVFGDASLAMKGLDKVRDDVVNSADSLHQHKYLH